MPIYLIIILILTMPAILNSNGKLKFDDILDRRIEFLDARLQPVNQDFSPAWFDGIEIRSETRDFELQKQEYNLRVTPLSLWVRSAQSDLYKSNIKKYERDIQNMIADYVEDLYKDWLRLIFDYHKNKLVSELLTVYEDEESVRTRMLTASSDNIDRFIDFREKKRTMEFDHLIRVKEYSIRKYEVLQVFNIDTSNNIDDALIDIQQIKNFIFSLKDDLLFEKTADYKALEIKNSIINNKRKVEEAENNQIFDFLQFNYRGPHDDLMNEKFSLRFAFRLPIAGDNKLKMEMLTVDKKELENTSFLKKDNFYKKLNREISNFEVLISEYEVLQQHNKDMEMESANLSANLATLANSPLWLISNKKNIIRNKIELLEITKDIYLKYIDLLDLIGVFVIEPNTNYLKVLPNL
jgi:hypothetical protein